MVIGYARVSREEEDLKRRGVSIEVQRALIEGACEGRGWQVDALYEDRGYSAKDLNRPGISDALGTLQKGDVLVVAKLDRLSRSTIDFGQLIEMSQKGGWSIVCLNPTLDFTTASGRMIANVLACFAQYERELISERTAAALAYKRDVEGVKLGRPKSIPPKVVHRMASLKADGLGCRAIARILNTEGVPTANGGRQWWAETVRKALA